MVSLDAVKVTAKQVKPAVDCGNSISFIKNLLNLFNEGFGFCLISFLMKYDVPSQHFAEC